MGKTTPNTIYLREKKGIKNGKELMSRLMTRCNDVNFAKLTKDVEPFLYDPRETIRVLHFSECIKGAGF